MIRRKSYKFVPLLLIFLSMSVGAESWLEDELLKQMSDLKLEVVRLKERVSQLESAQPDTTKSSINVELTGHALGADNASVAIVEFSDFQCGYCKRHYHSTFQTLKENYINTGKLRYYQRDFPLDFHNEAFHAAVAARCVGEQDLYWPMRDKLFSPGVKLNESAYRDAAKSIGADVKKFDACWQNGRQQSVVMNDIQYGRSLSVTGTPKFFVGKVRDGRLVDAVVITGSQPYDVFAKNIDLLMAN